MFFVVAATARSPARSCTRDASLNANGRRTSRSVSSVGRFFVDGIAKTNLSSLNNAGVQTAESQCAAFERIGQIKHGLSVPPLKLDATCVRVVRNFDHRLTDAQPRANGQITFGQVEIDD